MGVCAAFLAAGGGSARCAVARHTMQQIADTYKCSGSVISVAAAAPRRTPCHPAEAREILETEWDLLEALWTAGRGTAREITEALAQRRGWAYSTVKTMLDRMVDKGLVKGRQVGTVWEYTPAVPRRKAQYWAWRRFVDVAFGGAVSPALGLRGQGGAPDQEAARGAARAVDRRRG